MAYYDVSLLTQDLDFQSRVTACYAIETLNDNNALHPNAWVSEHIWDMAAQPGFAEAYAYALLTDVENPGRAPAVITDGQILAAVQAIIG